MTAPTAGIAPRRVLLTADELGLLRWLAGEPRLPADFRLEPRPDPGAAANGRPVGMLGNGSADPARSLRDRGLVRPGEGGSVRADELTVHPSVLANLAVLAAPEVLVETRVQTDTDGRPRVVRAAHAVAGGLGASLVRVDHIATAELSIFPVEALGRELARVVPQVGTARQSGHRPSGELVPLAALTQLGAAAQARPAVVAAVGADLRLGPAELARAQAVLAQLRRGVLHATVLAPPPVSGGPVEFGQVLWYATAGGWIGLAPESGRRGQPSVRVLPAEPADLGNWLAPLVGQVIG